MIYRMNFFLLLFCIKKGNSDFALSPVQKAALSKMLIRRFWKKYFLKHETKLSWPNLSIVLSKLCYGNDLK